MTRSSDHPNLSSHHMVVGDTGFNFKLLLSATQSGSAVREGSSKPRLHLIPGNMTSEYGENE